MGSRERAELITRVGVIGATVMTAVAALIVAYLVSGGTLFGDVLGIDRVSPPSVLEDTAQDKPGSGDVASKHDSSDTAPAPTSARPAAPPGQAKERPGNGPPEGKGAPEARSEQAAQPPGQAKDKPDKP